MAAAAWWPSPLTRAHRNNHDDHIDQHRRDTDHDAGDGQGVAVLAGPLDLVERDRAQHDGHDRADAAEQAGERRNQRADRHPVHPRLGWPLGRSIAGWRRVVLRPGRVWRAAVARRLLVSGWRGNGRWVFGRVAGLILRWVPGGIAGRWIRRGRVGSRRWRRRRIPGSIPDRLLGGGALAGRGRVGLVVVATLAEGTAGSCHAVQPSLWPGDDGGCESSVAVGAYRGEKTRVRWDVCWRSPR